MNKTNYSIISVFVICLSVGCSKPKTLSGVFSESLINQYIKSNKSFDFRTDGTVIYEAHLYTTSGGMTEEGKGTYTIKGETVTAIIPGTQQLSGSKEEQTTNKWIFRIDGNDLIELSKNGEKRSNKRLPKTS